MKSLDALRGQKFVLTKDYDGPRHVSAARSSEEEGYSGGARVINDLSASEDSSSVRRDVSTRLRICEDTCPGCSASDGTSF